MPFLGSLGITRWLGLAGGQLTEYAEPPESAALDHDADGSAAAADGPGTAGTALSQERDA